MLGISILPNESHVAADGFDTSLEAKIQVSWQTGMLEAENGIWRQYLPTTQLGELRGVRVRMITRTH